MCIFLFQARTVQIEQLHRTLVKLIAYSAEKLGHFLWGEFLVAYDGIGNHLRLIRFLPLLRHQTQRHIEDSG